MVTRAHAAYSFILNELKFFVWGIISFIAIQRIRQQRYNQQQKRKTRQIYVGDGVTALNYNGRETKSSLSQGKCIIIKQIYIFIVENDIILSVNNPVWLTEPIDAINDKMLALFQFMTLNMN